MDSERGGEEERREEVLVGRIYENEVMNEIDETMGDKRAHIYMCGMVYIVWYGMVTGINMLLSNKSLHQII